MSGKTMFQDVTAERQKVYGPTGHNFRAFGKAVTALLEMHYQLKLPHDIPAHVAAQIYTVGKVLRAVAPFDYNGDSRVDAHNYLDIADELDPRSPTHKDKHKEPA